MEHPAVAGQQTSQRKDAQQAREDRLAARLRDNLRKRKQQQRDRAEAAATTNNKQKG